MTNNLNIYLIPRPAVVSSLTFGKHSLFST